MKIGAVVQARMGSTRLPGKSLMPIWKDKTLLEMVLRRVLAAHKPEITVLATSDRNDCDPLEHLAAHLGADVVRGDEKDVLSRFVQAIQRHHFDSVIRICADNPLVDPGELDRLADFFESGGYDYAASTTPDCGLPDGLGAEMVRAELLSDHLPSANPHSREHVTTFIMEAPEHFFVDTYLAPRELWLPGIRLDIDTHDDLIRMRKFLSSLPDDKGPLWDAALIVESAKQFNWNGVFC
ncbi:hypothetical protein C4565_02875 [Candidatus Parcubacteria bacterium]|nr:MAG: hypothetical protein C4565_02875 [Candidatus Parcubacteria bacterium]